MNVTDLPMTLYLNFLMLSALASNNAAPNEVILYEKVFV